MDPDDFAIAAFGPDARLVQFTIEDAVGAAEMLHTLLGEKNEERTDYIFEHIDFRAVDGE